MKNKLPFLITSTLLLLLIVSTQSVYAQLDATTLKNVKKIYIQAITNVKEEGIIEQFLKIELEKQGFEIVDVASKANAILSGEIKAEVTLDGDKSTPNKSIYLYRLALPNNKILWNSEIKFISKAEFAEDNQYAAQQIAKRLAKDWKKASKNQTQNSK